MTSGTVPHRYIVTLPERHIRTDNVRNTPFRDMLTLRFDREPACKGKSNQIPNQSISVEGREAGLTQEHIAAVAELRARLRSVFLRQTVKEHGKIISQVDQERVLFGEFQSSQIREPDSLDQMMRLTKRGATGGAENRSFCPSTRVIAAFVRLPFTEIMCKTLTRRGHLPVAASRSPIQPASARRSRRYEITKV